MPISKGLKAGMICFVISLLSTVAYAKLHVQISRQGQALEPDSKEYQEILEAFRPSVMVQHEFFGDDSECNYPVFETRVEYSRYPSTHPGLQATFYVEIKQDSKNGLLYDRDGYRIFQTYNAVQGQQPLSDSLVLYPTKSDSSFFTTYFGQTNYRPDPVRCDDGFIQYKVIGTHNFTDFTWQNFNAAILLVRYWPDTNNMSEYIDIKATQDTYTENRIEAFERCPIKPEHNR